METLKREMRGEREGTREKRIRGSYDNGIRVRRRHVRRGGEWQRSSKCYDKDSGMTV